VVSSRNSARLMICMCSRFLSCAGRETLPKTAGTGDHCE
jgi:hypothetical protein